jgi:hypothetical protein
LRSDEATGVRTSTYSVLRTQYWVLSAQFWVLRTQYSVLSTPYVALSRFVCFPILCPLMLWPALVATAAPPKLNYLFPSGGQRGQTVAVLASGEFANWPVQTWSDRPGLAIACEKDKGKLSIVIAADAGAGTYWLRLSDGEGATSLRPFIVGTLPEALENEPNDAPTGPQSVEAQAVVHGKLAKNGDVDGYRLHLNQGETLVADLVAHSLLGSPMDAVLQVCELIDRPDATSQKPRTEAFVLAQNHDARGLDPQLAFTAPRAGRYLVRVFAFPSEPNSSINFSGGDNYVYRLTLTTGGFVDHALPLSLGREGGQVQLAGWNIPPDLQTIGLQAVDPADMQNSLTWLFHPELAGAAGIARDRGAGVVASDAASPESPQDVSLPVVISGRLEAAGDRDAFTLSAAKGNKLQLKVESRSLGFPVDPLLMVLDEAGQTVAEQDDQGRDGRDPELAFTAPADGRYRVVISDLAGRGGLRMVYRLTMSPPTPDFSLALAADSFILESGKPLEIPVSALARDGFREKIEIRAFDLPPGVIAEPVTFEPSSDAPGNSGSRGRGRRGGASDAGGPTAKLVIKAEPGAIQPGGGPIRIEGRTLGDSPPVRIAHFPLNLPLTGRHSAVWLTVRK